MSNTKRRGVVRFLVYRKAGDKLFTGVCLDFDIVEQAEDPEKLKKSLEEAAQGYLEAVAKNDLSDKLLNKPVLKKYQKVLADIENSVRLIEKKHAIKCIPSISDGTFFTRELSVA